MLIENATVLVVDDSQTNLKILTDYLSKTGYEVLVARSGEDALQLAELAQPDAILLDMMMPGIDGFETCRRLRKNENTREIPVIFMTSLADAKSKVEGFEAGGSDYVTKPFFIEEVLMRLRLHIERKRMEQDLKEEIIKIKQVEEELRILATKDSLTGLNNRRHFFDISVREFDRHQRYGSEISIAMLDLDHFKRVNDTYGHKAGDQVLRFIAQLCLHSLRGVDVVGRYGGEEFVILMPETGKHRATQVAERLRKEIENSRIAIDNDIITITASLGIASDHHNNSSSLEELLNCADEALYEAKEAGRNRVVIWQHVAEDDET
ncbi:MAG: diguanylate cyclase [Chloroflexi bacterium]|nr:diguanylate cyclase [Chloroflexota bacterium]